MIVRTRPSQYNKVITENNTVYASYTPFGKEWMGALFAQKPVQAGQILAYYDGIQLSKTEAETSNSQYLMIARDTNDLRKKITLDGDPKYLMDGLPNLAGFANYVTHKHANAVFADEAHRQKKPSPFSTFIVLRAKHDIPSGQEIRVDYDMGVSHRPFRDQMIVKGVSRQELDSADFKKIIWTYPLGS